MRIDANLTSPPATAAADLGREAERLGFDGVWATETARSPFPSLTRVADVTDELDVGTAIAVAFPRSPMVTAYTAWDLQALSGGRFVLGLGTQVKGHIERRFSGTWESPGPRLREYVAALRAIWDAWAVGEEPNYTGEHYSITLCPPAFRPDPIDHPDVPIYIAGVNEYNLRLAGEVCDGLHVHPLHSPTYLSEVVVPNVRLGAERAGRDPGEVTLAASTFAVAGEGEEREKAREEVRRQIGFYGSTRTYRPVFEVHGWGDTVDDLHALSVEGRWDDLPDLVTDEMVDALSVEGSWGDLRGRLEARYDHLDRVSLYTPFRGEAGWANLFD